MYPTTFGWVEPVYATPPVKIGKHEWVCFVYRHFIGGVMCSGFCWRPAGTTYPWMPASEWPSYDPHDEFGGCPKSLRSRVWNPHEAELRAALNGQTTETKTA